MWLDKKSDAVFLSLQVNKETNANKEEGTRKSSLANQYTIELNEELCYCDCKSLLKSSETLSFLVRDAAHITPLNFESCVHAIRSFVETSLNGGKYLNWYCKEWTSHTLVSEEELTLRPSCHYFKYFNKVLL